MNKRNSNAIVGEKNAKALVWILIVLFLVIVGLIVTLIVINKINESKTNDGDDVVVISEDDDKETIIDCSKLDEMRDPNEKSDCFDLVYSNGEPDNALALYDDALNAADDSGEYEVFGEYLKRKAETTFYGIGCEAAFDVLKDERVDKVPANKRIEILGLGRDYAYQCDNEEIWNVYNDRIIKLVNEGGLDEESN